jgi:hypothetical protein
MTTYKINMAGKLVPPMMDKLTVKDPDKSLRNASYGFFSVDGVNGRILHDQFSLMLSKNYLTAVLGVVSNLTILYEHPATLLCLETDPTDAIVRLLSIIAGLDLAGLSVSPESFPSVNEAANDVWRSGLYVCHPAAMDMNGFRSLVSHQVDRGVDTVFIDAPARLRLRPRTPSTAAEFPGICRDLCSIARTHRVTIVGGHCSMKVSDMAPLVDQVIRIEDLGDRARFGVLAKWENKPRYSLAKREACGRYNSLTRHPWSDTEKRFETARKS